MKFSLLIGTLNRVQLLENCLQSLKKQRYSNFEIIIVDQSDEDDTEILVNSLNWDKIIYTHVPYKGLSKARNEAIRMANGDCFCLIDDDAEYGSNYLYLAHQHLCHSKVILSGYIFNPQKGKDFVQYRSNISGKKLSFRQIIRTCPSPALIIPREVLESVGFFDERFGVGSIYGAGEETDYLLRAIEKGFKVIYNKNLEVVHPIIISRPKVPLNVLNFEKAYSYSVGTGALYKRHIIEKGNFRLIISLSEMLIKLCVKVFVKNRKMSFYQLKGVLHGMTIYQKEKPLRLK